MKLSKLFMTSLLSLLTVGVFAEKVTVNTTEFKPGGTVDMSVSLENTSNVSGYAMRLYLPEGISVVTGENVYKLSDRHGQEYSITPRAQKNAPPMQPSHVFLGEICGTILCLPIVTPTR